MTSLQVRRHLLRLGGDWPNIRRALWLVRTHVDNLKTAPSWSQRHAFGMFWEHDGIRLERLTLSRRLRRG